MDIHEFLRTIRTGQLSVDEIGVGMHKCFTNASELIQDAELLLESRPGRALSLAVLAIEEVAKTILLAKAAARAARASLSWNDLQEDLDLRSHKHKQEVFAAYGEALLNKISENGTWYDQKLPGDLCPLLDFMKQLGFYVDVANGQFISPSEFGSDNKAWAEWLISVVKERLISFSKIHATKEGSIKAARNAAELAKLISEAADEKQLKEKIHEFIKKYIQST
jgi:AbiV family abortive infection protein